MDGEYLTERYDVFRAEDNYQKKVVDDLRLGRNVFFHSGHHRVSKVNSPPFMMRGGGFTSLEEVRNG